MRRAVTEASISETLPQQEHVVLPMREAVGNGMGSHMRNLIPLAFSAAIVIGSIAQAQAMPAQVTAPTVSSAVVEVALCGPGTHLGPYGHYCWPNGHPYGGPCPPGYVLGPQGHYCWPVGYSVPPHYVGVCPPGYHLGRDGYRCWR